MKQEPVAWINDENIVAVGECPKDFIHSWKPLYTAPKELSDEEIMKIGEIYKDVYVGMDKWQLDVLMFARAILKKASEK